MRLHNNFSFSPSHEPLPFFLSLLFPDDPPQAQGNGVLFFFRSRVGRNQGFADLSYKRGRLFFFFFLCGKGSSLSSLFFLDFFSAWSTENQSLWIVFFLKVKSQWRVGPFSAKTPLTSLPVFLLRFFFFFWTPKNGPFFLTVCAALQRSFSATYISTRPASASSFFFSFFHNDSHCPSLLVFLSFLQEPLEKALSSPFFPRDR